MYCSFDFEAQETAEWYNQMAFVRTWLLDLQALGCAFGAPQAARPKQLLFYRRRSLKTRFRCISKRVFYAKLRTRTQAFVHFRV